MIRTYSVYLPVATLFVVSLFGTMPRLDAQDSSELSSRDLATLRKQAGSDSNESRAATCELPHRYELGLGTPKDLAQAQYWYFRCAEQFNGGEDSSYENALRSNARIFKTLHPSDTQSAGQSILLVLEAAKSKHLRTDLHVEDGSHNYIKHCNDKNTRYLVGGVSTVCNAAAQGDWILSSHDSQAHHFGLADIHHEDEGLLALQRACAFPSTEYNYCATLGDFYLYVQGNVRMAIEVFEHAPNCQGQFSRGELENSKCLQGSANLYRVFGDTRREFAVVQPLCQQYNVPDACKRVNALGGTADVAAAREAFADQQQRDSDNAHQAQADREESQRQRDQRFNSTLAAIQGIGGTNTIQNTANQQAAAIRAVGDANAAKQRVAAQQQAMQQAAATQPATQTQPAQQNANANSSLTGGVQVPAMVNSASNASSNAAANTSSLTVSGGQYNNCVSTFYDPRTYNWLAFQNNCGQTLHVTWIFGTEVGLGSSADITPGGNASTGYTRSEVSAKNGWEVYVCPAGYLSVDTQGNGIRGGKAQPYVCKQR